MSGFLEIASDAQICIPGRLWGSVLGTNACEGVRKTRLGGRSWTGKPQLFPQGAPGPGWPFNVVKNWGKGCEPLYSHWVCAAYHTITCLKRHNLGQGHLWLRAMPREGHNCESSATNAFNSWRAEGGTDLGGASQHLWQIFTCPDLRESSRKDCCESFHFHPPSPHFFMARVDN